MISRQPLHWECARSSGFRVTPEADRCVRLTTTDAENPWDQAEFEAAAMAIESRSRTVPVFGRQPFSVLAVPNTLVVIRSTTLEACSSDTCA